VEWDPPRRFIDVQRRGPYTLWIHEHRFEALDGGTRVHDVVQYAAPGGELVRKIMIGRDIDSIFNYRKMQLEKHFA
jgi:ligand-binding SRPBCC domain-containing protein